MYIHSINVSLDFITIIIMYRTNSYTYALFQRYDAYDYPMGHLERDVQIQIRYVGGEVQNINITCLLVSCYG